MGGEWGQNCHTKFNQVQNSAIYGIQCEANKNINNKRENDSIIGIPSNLYYHETGWNNDHHVSKV